MQCFKNYVTYIIRREGLKFNTNSESFAKLLNETVFFKLAYIVSYNEFAIGYT